MPASPEDQSVEHFLSRQEVALGLDRVDRLRSTASQIASAIAGDIATRRLAPGERLPEEALASQFGTSRGPVRDAFRLLRASGMIELRDRRGARVAHWDRSTLYQQAQIRSVLFGLAVRLVTEDPSEMDLAALEQGVGYLEQCLEAGRIADFMRLRYVLGEMILAASKSPPLIDLMHRNRDSLLTYYESVATIEKRRLHVRTSRQIVAAMQAGDADAAERAARRTVMEGYEAIDFGVD